MFEEEYIYMAGLTHNSAIIAWGKFFFDDSGKVLDRGAMESIGASSVVFAQPFAEVSVRDATTDEALPPIISAGGNFCLVRGLKADTEYRYVVKIKEGETWRAWGSSQHRIYDPDRRRMRPPQSTEHRAYNNRFRTYPDPETPAKVKFLVLGDFGRSDEVQFRLANTMKSFVNESADGARFIITTGDNIYSHGGGSGERDDDWFDSFFQPYRYIINQIPVYPSMGNHDSTEQGEAFFQGAEERRQVYENFYIGGGRFGPDDVPVRLDWKRDSGLFYRFRFGKDATFVCLDTSKEGRRIDGENFHGRLTDNEKNLSFVERCFDEASGAGAKWCVPFGHHPPYSRGNSHGDAKGVRNLFDRVRGKGLRAYFCGHDHNFQHLTKDRTVAAKVQDDNSAPEENKCHIFLSGGGSEPRSATPRKDSKGTLRAWGGTDQGHFLVVTIDGDEMIVEPVGEGGQPLPLKDRGNGDQDFAGPIRLRA